MKIKYFYLFFIIMCHNIYAQSITISGFIKDAESKESIIGANIYNTLTKTGTTSNEYGYYSLSINKIDTMEIIISYLGYITQAKKLTLDKNTSIDFMMSTRNELSEVLIKSNKNDENVNKAQVGVISVPMRELKSLPVLAGERDVMKVIQFLPGVQQAQEGTSGFLVRGGNIDQNLVQLDEAAVYNPNHLFGLFSTFNINALNNVQLIKGGFPSKYGGRLSSIVDITMKEGNKEKHELEGGIGLLSANISIQGPLIKNKSSFIISGRRSYLDLLLKPFTPDSKQGTSYRFYDFNAKINYDISAKDKIFLSVFRGNDRAAYTGANSLNYGIDFGNSTATLRWNHLFGSKLFSNTSVIINQYNLGLGSTQGNYYALLYTGIDDVNLKSDVSFHPSNKHQIKFGGAYFYHTLYPASFSAKIPKKGNRVSINKDSIAQKYSNELSLYLGDEWDINSRLSINIGSRFTNFITKNVSYNNLEPRLIAKFSLGKNSSLKVAYTIMNQYLHVVPNSTASLPTDIWLPSSKLVKPQNSAQYSIGLFKNYKSNEIETSLEFYYKDMSNQVLFKEGTQLTLVQNIENALTFGHGTSYGMEIFIKKNSGKITGWLSYTLSKTNQKFDELNFGKKFPFTYDRRHNLSIVGTYDFSPRWTISSDFVFHTGNAFTIPTGLIPVSEDGGLYDGSYYDYTYRNNARLRAYHRLDISASYKKQRHFFRKKYYSELIFGAYNLYSRLNPYFVYLTVDPNTHVRKANQVSLLPFIPSISYNFKF